MITQDQGDAIISLLTAILDELQRPRLENARQDAQLKASLLAMREQHGYREAAEQAERDKQPRMFASGGAQHGAMGIREEPGITVALFPDSEP